MLINATEEGGFSHATLGDLPIHRSSFQRAAPRRRKLLKLEPLAHKYAHEYSYIYKKNTGYHPWFRDLLSTIANMYI